MSQKFEVDFSEALRQLAEFQAKTKGLGQALDRVQQSANKPAGAAAGLIKEMHKHYTELEKSLTRVGIDAESAGEVLKRSRDTAQGLFTKLAAENLKLTTQARAYNGELKELERLLKDSGAKSSFVKWSQKVSNIQAELTGQNKMLKASYSALGTAAGRDNLILKQRVATATRMAIADYRQVMVNKEVKQQLELLSSTLGSANAILKTRASLLTKEITEDTRLTGKLGEVRRAYEGLNGGVQAQIAVQTEMNRGLTQSATHRQREQNQVDELRRKHESLTGGLAEQAAQLRVLNSAREREITELTRERTKIEELQRALTSLNGGEQEQIARLNAKIAARRRQIQEDGRAAVVMEELSATAARLIVSDERQKAAIDAKNRATVEQARSLQQMTRAEAEAIARGESLAASNKKHADSMLDEARKAHGMSKAQQELTQNRDREIERLNRLKAQKDLLNTSYGRELAAIKLQIHEQERYNRLLSLSTSELLGFSNAQRKKTASLQAGAQTAAMMRAALSGLHTNIGMYTSATILAASSTYAVAAALRSAVSIGAEFTATMARNDAIMSSSRPSWMTDNGSLEAMEGQVRALGQSTMFTASEVAQGLTELGMAGLAAGDAVVALRPALDLAVIGNIQMSQSADIATNVMMTFGKSASDLGEIVDVMATAVTNSNTTIDQLANALTYAGPAAQTAGISMRDTVAAIEAMANSGIKASRSGTALRRLFVSLLNPTEKGSKMLETYGISVKDAEGSTRGLVNIVGQLNKALSGLSGGEKLTAIQNLVGVYATSPVAALVEQSGNLEQLRRQLDDTAGAAERMREKIENGLKFDWKQVVSAFEEVKIAAFEGYEMQMREASASLAKYLIDLTAPFETLADGTVITNLDMVLKRAENIAMALGAVGAGALAFKFMSGNMFGAFATDMGKVSDRFRVFKSRVDAASLGQVTFSRVTAASHASVMAQSVVVSSTTTALGTMNGVLATTAVRAGAVATAFSVLSRSLGWVGLLASLGYAFHELFNTDTRQEVLDQKGAVGELKSSYDELKEAMKQVALQKEKDALRGQVASDKESIKQLQEKQNTLPGLIADGKRHGVDTSVMEAALAGIPGQMARYQEQIAGTEKILSEMGVTSYELASALDTQVAKIGEVIVAYQEWQSAQLALTASPETTGVEGVAKVEALKKAYEDLAAAATTANTEAEKARGNLATLKQTYSAATQAQEQAALAKQFERTATATEKYKQNLGDLTKIEAEMARLEAEDAKAIAEGRYTERPGADTTERLLKQQQELIEKREELRAEAEREAQTLEESRRALEDFNRTDSENLEVLKEDLADVMLQRIINNQLIAEGGLLGAAASIAESDRLKEELRIRQMIVGLEQRLAKPPKKEQKSELEKSLEKAQSSYEALRKQFDPLGVSLDDVKEKTEQLALLHTHGKITAEQKAKAIWELRKAHYELTLEQDKNRQSLDALRESYLDSPFSSTLDDMIEMNRLLKDNVVSLEEYRRIQASMKERAIESATSGLPTATLQMGEASSSPFSDWMGTEIERAQGMAQFPKRQDELFTGYENDVDRIHREFEARQEALDAEFLQQAEHAERLKQLEQEKNAALLASHSQFGDASKAIDKSRAEYSEQMGTMVMMSMLGSAENILGMFASVGEDATTAQKAAFVAQKALAIAQILMYTHLAAAQAMTIPGDPMKVMGIPLASMITAQGYASAGLVGALAIGQLTGATGSSSGGSSYSGAYDDGGFIPYNSYGIVGEYGPEIVHGPANVTGREKSAKKLAAGGANEYNITLAPQITVQSGDGQGGGASDAQARELANTLKNVTLSTLREQTRPGGMLDTWISSKRSA